ncbi:hypothetical protein C5167_025495 [Papaver somniferum]|uniref:Uncharacterized protein n=1 Tax=Papaver somniferum TaxID=3469 RepID=A0A4Y7JVG8_PAPSO|nr:hypothetical protein C5167_025495 [Papaver somniferum]
MPSNNISTIVSVKLGSLSDGVALVIEGADGKKGGAVRQGTPYPKGGKTPASGGKSNKSLKSGVCSMRFLYQDSRYSSQSRTAIGCWCLLVCSDTYFLVLRKFVFLLAIIFVSLFIMNRMIFL